MRYVYVENGEVLEGPCSLPESWRNISGMAFIEEDRLLEIGWRPYRFVPYEGDMTYKVSSGARVEITETEYIEYQEVRDKTQEEIREEVESRWQAIKARRNALLLDSDWTQLPDVELTPEAKDQWKEYRRVLRNISNAESPDHVSWPDPPPNSKIVNL